MKRRRRVLKGESMQDEICSVMIGDVVKSGESLNVTCKKVTDTGRMESFCLLKPYIASNRTD